MCVLLQASPMCWARWRRTSLQLFTALDRLTESPLGMRVCARHKAGQIACFICLVHAVWFASMMRRLAQAVADVHRHLGAPLLRCCGSVPSLQEDMVWPDVAHGFAFPPFRDDEFL